MWVAIASAAWLGILTSISPCPLATNIAAISFLGQSVGQPRRVFLNGALYALGRMVIYVALAWLIVSSLLSVPEVSAALQRHMSTFLGPLLILAGMVLLGLIDLRLPGLAIPDSLKARLESRSWVGALAMGFLFGLSFCPVSAALFFGSLIPAALSMRSPLLLPAVYGAGTALPVLPFAGLLAFGGHALGTTFDRLALAERWA
jgi:cytochrome c-type biogenesis protein